MISAVGRSIGASSSDCSAKASVFPLTSPSYPSRTTQVSHPLRSNSATMPAMLQRQTTYFKMPALTTARTTAFMPALSPPEVNIASFIAAKVVVLVQVGRKAQAFKLLRGASSSSRHLRLKSAIQRSLSESRHTGKCLERLIRQQPPDAITLPEMEDATFWHSNLNNFV